MRVVTLNVFFTGELIYGLNSMKLKNYSNQLFILINDKSLEEFTHSKEIVRELVLRYEGTGYFELPSDALEGIETLETLILFKVYCTDYSFFKVFKQLRYLEIAYNDEFSELPVAFNALTNLEELTIRQTNLQSIDWEWECLNKLVHLTLESNQIVTIPSSFHWHQSLESLSFSGNPITSIQLQGNVDAPNLSYLSLGETNLESCTIPNGSFKGLERLYLYGSRLQEIPVALLKLPQLKQLYFSNNNLSSFEAANLIINNSITYLDISSCHLTEIPLWIQFFEGIFELLLEDNLISTLPDWLGTMPYLTVIQLKGTLVSKEEVSLFKAKYSDKKWQILL